MLPRRVPGYNAGQLDQLCASGEIVWVGAGLDRVAIFFRDDAPVLGRPGAAAPPEGDAPDRIRAVLGNSAEFWHDLVVASGIKAVLNFSPGALQVPADVKLKSVDLTVSLESLSFYLAQGDIHETP